MKKPALKIKWERHYPPGFEWEAERSLFVGLLSFASSWGIIGFLYRYFDALSSLDDPMPKMEQFYVVLGRAFFWFPIVICLMLAAIVMHYAHHHVGSKSIYLMRRLPNKWELHRRCLTVPVVSVCLTVIVAVLLLLIYYGIYVLFTPSEFLRPGQLELLWKNWSVM